MISSAPTRRQLGRGAGLLIAFSLLPPVAGSLAADEPPAAVPGGSLTGSPDLDAWLKVDANGEVTLFSGKVEFGQGIKTALKQIAAEELDLPVDRIALITADTARTPNEAFTAGSHSVQDSGGAIRAAAAQARRMLVQAAASRLECPAAQLTTAGGAVSAPDGRSIRYGVLAEALALHVPVEADGPRKDANAYRLVGNSAQRVDIPAKLTGRPAYLQDIRLPGMLHARVARPPSYGAKLLDVALASIEAMPGVVKAVRQGDYLAVVAQSEWQAVQAGRALEAAARWREVAVLPDPARLNEAFQALPAQTIPIDDRRRAGAAGGESLRARYTRPYLLHGSIGPSCALALSDASGLTVWTHSQGVYPLRGAIAQLLRLDPKRVRCIHAEGAGCYGHNEADDAAADAALLATLMPGSPIRVQLMRHQEHLWEPAGSAMIGEVQATLNRDGRIADWRYDVWSNTHVMRPVLGAFLLQNTLLPEPLPTPPARPIPMPEGDGSRNSVPIYTVDGSQVVYHFIPEMPIRVSSLRSLGAYLNVFAIEGFMDELAEAAKADPVAFRLDHLADPRARAVVNAAADRFGWRDWRAERGSGQGRGFGFARYKNMAAYCAVALEVSVDRASGEARLGRVVAAVDAGQTVNPDGLRNQIEGGIVQSASWTLIEELAFDRQRILSRDWASYPILRFSAAPASVEVVVVDQPGAPFLGAGEAAQGPAAAAIGNAVADATGVRFRDTPLSPAKLKAGWRQTRT